MNSINVLILFLFLQVCESSNSQLRKRNVGLKVAEEDDVAVFQQTVREQESPITVPTAPTAPAAQPGYFDYFHSGIFGAPEPEPETPAPKDDSTPVQLATRTISGYEAVLLVPALLENLKTLEANFERIGRLEITIAAIKMKSFVPDQLIKLEKDLPASSAFEECDESTVSDSRTYIINSIVALIKPLTKESKTFALTQINSLDFNLKSLEEFIAEKEAEIAQILFECAVEFCRLKVLLHSNSPVLTGKLTPGWLLTIINRLKRLNLKNDWFQKCRKKATEVPTKNNHDRVHLNRGEIGKLVMKLAEILEKI